MEKERLIRSLGFLTGQGLAVYALITDGHVQIRKYMLEQWLAIKHMLDGWHVEKGKGIIIFHD